MKLREIFYCMGLKPKPKRFGYQLRQQTLRGKSIQYAQWLHPRAYDCQIKESELESLEQFLQPGDVAVDIGAHMGDSTLPMAWIVGREGCVIALEANPYVFETLQANAVANPDCMHIKPFNVAATDENRNYEFSYNDPGFMNGGAVEKTRSFRKGDAFRHQIQGVRLQDFLEENLPELIDRIRYVKIDTEGYDLYVLQSIQELLKRVQPYVQAEVMKGTPQAYRFEMHDLLKSLGYEVYRSTGCQRSTAEISRAEMMEHSNFDIFGIPPRQAARAVA